jgi:hypothetical protein
VYQEITGEIFGDTMAGEFFYDDMYYDSKDTVGSWRATKIGGEPTNNHCVMATVRLEASFYDEFGELYSELCINSSFNDPILIVDHAQIEGMGGVQNYTYDGSGWVSTGVYCTTSPEFPMEFTTTIYFDNGSSLENTFIFDDW